MHDRLPPSQPGRRRSDPASSVTPSAIPSPQTWPGRSVGSAGRSETLGGAGAGGTAGTGAGGGGSGGSGGGAGRGGAGGVSRRSFIQTLGLSAASGAIASAAERAHSETVQDAAADQAPAVLGPGPAQISLKINGQPMQATIDPATTLMEALRWHLNLTGSKEVCDRGACGGCSVLVDGKLIASCMMLAADAVESNITTIEGLSRNGQLDPVQEEFIRHDALQCGFCTPGLVIASRALLNEHPRPTLEQIKYSLSGNICRCGTYTNVFNAVLAASGQEPVNDAGEIA